MDRNAHPAGQLLFRLIVLQSTEQRRNHERQHHRSDYEYRNDADRARPALPQRLPVLFILVEL